MSDMSETIKVAVVRIVPPDATEKQRQFGMARARSFALELESVIGDAILAKPVDARAFMVETSCKPATFNFCQRPILDKIELPDGWEPDYYQVLSPYKNPRHCGFAGIGSPWSIVFEGCSENTGLHEWLHSLGLDHAAKLVGDEVWKYGDPFSLMGNKLNRRGINARQYDLLGLMAPEMKITLKDTIDTVRLRPAEIHDDAVNYGEYKMAIIESGRHTYYASIRKAKGHAESLSGGIAGELIFIHKRYRPEELTLLIGTMRPGELMELEGVKVMHGGMVDDECALLHVGHNIALDVVNMAEKVAWHVKPEHAGIWYDPFCDGSGLDIHIDPETGVGAMAWFTYRENGGTEYYTGNFTLGGGEFPLYVVVGGSFENPAAGRKKLIGSAVLSFGSDDKGVMVYKTEAHGRNAIPLTRLTQKGTDKSGVFYDPERENEGAMVRMADDEYGVVYLYTRGSGRFIPGGSRSVWLMGYITNGAVVWYRTKGVFGKRMSDIYEVGAGRCTFEGDGLLIEGVLNDAGLPKGFSIQMEKLV